jgi:CDP-diglyceride synthetase
VGVGRDVVGLPGTGGAEHGQDGADTSANSRGRSWSGVAGGALFWALVSVVVATESANQGMRRRKWGWVASFLVASVVAAYAFFGRFV